MHRSSCAARPLPCFATLRHWSGNRGRRRGTMTEHSLYPVPEHWARTARVDAAGYERLYGNSLANPGTFWREQARRLDWIKFPELAGDWSFDESDFHIRWFTDG